MLYLDHLLNLELPPINHSCSTCGSLDTFFRFLDCYGGCWFCQDCLIESHNYHPFHWPHEWKNGSFEHISLCDLGYVFKLGHCILGAECPEDDGIFGDRQMTIIHVNGVFEHCMRFCKCQGANSEHIQLFNHHFFLRVSIALKPLLLWMSWNNMGLMQWSVKCWLRVFFQKLRRVTNNAFPEEVPVCSSFNFI